MTNEEGLLEFLRHQVGANYISDLRKVEYHSILINTIQAIDSTFYTVEEWRDVIDYLTGTKTEISSSEEGKETLLEVL